MPVLALYLAWERWRSRPPARPPGRAGRALRLAAGAAGLALFLAALPVLEANALWPTAQWAGASGPRLRRFGGARLAGGAAWASDFAFPVGFVFTALAWPTAVHLWVIRVLVAGNAQHGRRDRVDPGHPAVVNGNVIMVANGLVGRRRGLQRAPIAPGGVDGRLVPRGVSPAELAPEAGAGRGPAAVALAPTWPRTAFLTWLAASHSIAASERWHDRAGIAELVVTLAIVALLAERAARKGRPPGPAAAPPGPVRWPVGWSVAALAAALLAEGSTQAWYLWHEWRAPAAHVRWTLVAPDPSWRPVPIPGRAQSILQYSSGSGLEWSDPASDSRAWVFVLNWEGDAAEGENPEWHDPTICLPASGVRLDRGPRRDPARPRGDPMRITGYRFTVGRSPLAAKFHNNLGMALLAKGLVDEAITESQAALRLEPDFAPAHLNLGSAFIKQGQINHAIAQFTEVVRLEPDNDAGHINLRGGPARRRPAG